VLARHLKRCEKAQDLDLTIVPVAKGQTRAKSACNQCAEAKVKCDSRTPCRQCKRKGVACKYTRQGYSDPYISFQMQALEGVSVSSPIGAVQDSDCDLIPIHDDSLNSVSVAEQQQNLDLSMDYLHDQPIIDPSNASEVADIGPTNQAGWAYAAQVSRAFAEGQEFQWMPADFDLAPALDFIFDTYPDLFPQGGVRETDIDLQNAASHQAPQIAPDEELLLHRNREGDVTDATSLADARTTSSCASYDSTNSIHGGFNLSQLDPVEAKCIEIRALLSALGRSAPDGSTLSYVNRSNLIHCVGLYGKHFQPNLPIIHRSTFTIAETSPALLLALMLVGACYSEKTVPRTIVDQLTMHLSAWIGSQTVSYFTVQVA
jgi:hypothetical protein